MKLTEGEKRLLALHYFFPVPKNRLNGLYEIDPNLENFIRIQQNELAHIIEYHRLKKQSIERRIYLKT